MNFELLQHVVGTIIKTIQTTAIQVVRELKASTYKVHIDNPQTKVEVTGKVEVDQKRVENQLKNNALAVRELKKPLQGVKNAQESGAKDVMKAIATLKTAIEKLKLDPQIDVKAPIVNIKAPDVHVPEIKIPEIKIPEIKAPQVHVDAPIVNVPEQAAPIVNVEAPDLSDLTKIIEFFNSLSVKKPLPVRLSDGKKFYEALQQMADIYAGSTFSAFQDSTGQEARAILNKNNELLVTTAETWSLNNTHRVTPFTYLGQETVDGRWMIQRVEKDGDFNIMKYATSKNNSTISLYDDAWTNHETLTFSRVSEAL